MATVGHATPVSKGVAHSKLSLAKLVELRRRSRIDRARQLASNIETQAHILRSTELYNLEVARVQLDKQLGGMGGNVPLATRAIYDARLAMLTEEVRKLSRHQQDSMDSGSAQPRGPGRSARMLRMTAGQGTVDALII